MSEDPTPSGLTYKLAGVDRDAAALFKEMIRERVAKTWPDMAKEIGGFAGGGKIPAGSIRVVGSTDGTGTKSILSALVGDYRIGQDVVAMAAVDTYVSGNTPTYLLDTLEVAHLIPEVHIQVIDSIIDACVLSGCSVIGGETAELPDMFRHPWMMNLNASVIGFRSLDPAHSNVPIVAGQPVYGWLSEGLTRGCTFGILGAYAETS